MSGAIIADTKIAVQLERINEIIQKNQCNSKRFSLQGGDLGYSLFLSLYALHTRQKELRDKAVSSFDYSCVVVNTDESLIIPRDFCDFGAIVHYLTQKGILQEKPLRFLEDVDSFLYEEMRQAFKLWNVSGFSTGAVGYGRYFLMQAQQDPNRFQKEIRNFVNGLSSSAMKTPFGCYWPSIRKINSATDLSLAHGQASIILLLVCMIESGIEEADRLYTLLEEGIAHINGCLELLNEDNLSLSLQEGHLGVGYSLLRAGSILKDTSWCSIADSMLKRCAYLCLQDKIKFLNNGLANGRSGAIITFDRISRLTNEEIYKSASVHCLENLVNNFHPDEINSQNTGELDFGNGISGIGATLIKSYGNIEFDSLAWLI